MKSDKDKIDIGAVEDHDGILTIRGGGARRDWNGIHYKQGMSGKNVGTTNLSANIATIPPGGVAYAHIHVGFEVILYIIEGKVRHEFGEGLKQVIEHEAHRAGSRIRRALICGRVGQHHSVRSRNEYLNGWRK